MEKLKVVSACSLSEAHQAWNQGFADYYVNVQMSLDQFTFRFGQDELSYDYSFVAYSNEEPVGIILNGIKMLHGQKWAWNGGTSVAGSHRRLGIAKKLMKASLEVYRNEGVEVACLEAFSANEKAISLYEAMGYRVIDRLLFLENKDNVDFLRGAAVNEGEGKKSYSFRYGIPQDVSKLPFYKPFVPWRTQWHFIRGESIIAFNPSNQAVGYALFQRKIDEQGNLRAVTLYQCAVDEKDQANSEGLIRYLLAHVFPARGSQSYTRTTYNLPQTNNLLVSVLKEAGFKPAFTPDGVPLEQVFMINPMGNKVF